MTIRTLSPLTAVLAAAVALGCDGPPPTAATESAALPQVAASHDAPLQTGVVTGSFPGGEICGVPLERTDFFSAGPTWELLPGNEPSKAAGNLLTTWTAASGEVASVRHAGETTREIVEWLDEDTFVAIQTTAGLAEVIKASDGPPLTFDAGRIVVRLVVRLLPGGGSTLLAPPEFLEVDGPHPDIASGFALFCPAVRDALLGPGAG